MSQEPVRGLLSLTRRAESHTQCTHHCKCISEQLVMGERRPFQLRCTTCVHFVGRFLPCLSLSSPTENIRALVRPAGRKRQWPRPQSSHTHKHRAHASYVGATVPESKGDSLGPRCAINFPICDRASLCLSFCACARLRQLGPIKRNAIHAYFDM